MRTNVDELNLGNCVVIYELNGVVKRYETRQVCDIPLSNGGTWRVVYFVIPQESRIIGFEQY